MKNQNIMIRVTEKQKEEFTELAKSNGMSLSDFIRDILTRECVKHELSK